MAAMGAKVYKDSSPDPVKDFLEILKKGYSDKSYFVKLNKIREEQKADPTVVTEKRIASNVKTDMTFDMKHLPINPTTKDFVWHGIPYQFVSFETEPLDTSTDYHILRALRKRDRVKDIPKTLLDADYPFQVLTEYSDQEIPADVLLAAQTTPAATATAPQKKVKTKIINGMKMPQTIAFNLKSDFKLLIENQRNGKAIPTYMEQPDYLEMLAKFDDYRTGEDSLQLTNDAISDDEVENIPHEIEDVIYDDINDD